MNEVQVVYPIDMLALVSGDFIGPDVLEPIVGKPKEYSVYGVRVQTIIETIMKERSDLYCWYEHFGIRVGLPEECLDHAIRRQKKGINRLRKTARMIGRIPTHLLPQERRREHEVQVMVAAARAAVVGGITAKRIASDASNGRLPNSESTKALIGHKEK